MLLLHNEILLKTLILTGICKGVR